MFSRIWSNCNMVSEAQWRLRFRVQQIRFVAARHSFFLFAWNSTPLQIRRLTIMDGTRNAPTTPAIAKSLLQTYNMVHNDFQYNKSAPSLNSWYFYHALESPRCPRVVHDLFEVRTDRYHVKGCVKLVLLSKVGIHTTSLRETHTADGSF